MIVDEPGHRINKLSTECQTIWEPRKTELEHKVTHLKRRWEQARDDISPADIGGREQDSIHSAGFGEASLTDYQ